MGLDYFSSTEAAVTALLAGSVVPAFLLFGTNMFRAFALIRIGWEGIETMWSSEPSDARIFSFVRLLMHLTFVYAMVTFYRTPVPGLGISFSHLITDQMAYLSSVLDGTSVRKVFEHWVDISNRFVHPSVIDVGAGVMYAIFMLVLLAAEGLAFIVRSFGIIATAALTVVGPIFIPFLAMPTLEWLFWGWFKCFLQYAFMQVLAYVYMMLFEQYLFNLLTSLPQGITSDLYPLYGFQVISVAIAFCLGVLLIPVLNSQLFSGGGSSSTASSVVNFVKNRF